MKQVRARARVRSQSLIPCIIFMAVLVATLVVFPQLRFADEVDEPAQEAVIAEDMPAPSPDDEDSDGIDVASNHEGDETDKPAQPAADTEYLPADDTDDLAQATTEQQDEDNRTELAPEQDNAAAPPLDEYGLGGMAEDHGAPSIHDGTEDPQLAPAAAPPTKFDSRDYGWVSKVKDQNPFATCWAFSSVAAIESSILKQGLATEVDLSERQVAFFTYNLPTDPLGNTKGDQNIAMGDSYGSYRNTPYLGAGANAGMVSLVLASGIGIANENSRVPSYNSLAEDYYASSSDTEFHNRTMLNPGLAFGPSVNSYRLVQQRGIPMKDRTDVKRAIQNYGGAAVLINFLWDYYDPSNNSYYMSGVTKTNHMVELIGWDDNFNNFSNLSNKPTRKGAWLAKNSWGPFNSYASIDPVDYGYFWISYEDSVLNVGDRTAYVFKVEPASATNIYQYDGSTGWCYNYINSGGSLANVYEVKANKAGAEQLKSVSLTLESANVNYSVQIYGELTTKNNPTSGTPMLSKPVTGKTSYAGFYTIPLNEKVNLREGSLYSIVFTLSRADGSKIAYNVESTYGAKGLYKEKYKWVHFVNNAQAGQSFEKDTAKAAWDDLAKVTPDAGDEPGSTARVKGFSVNNNALRKLVAADFATVATQTYTGKAITPVPNFGYGSASSSSVKRSNQRGSAYQLSYSSNVNVGTATVRAVGKGDYVGLATLKFQIVPAPISKASVATIATQSWTGSALKPKPKLSFNGTTLKEGTDYTLSYKNNTKTGTATLTITGKGNFTGSVAKTFKIVDNSIPVYWIQHKVTGENMYTTDKNEVKELSSVKKTWTNKGIKWYAPTSGTPVYRLNFKNGADHHYTTDTNEVTQLKKNKNWQIDNSGKPMFYSGGSIRIYRMNSDVRAAQYNAGKKISGFHMFATSTSEVKSLKASSWKWKQDAVEFYAVKLK